MLLSADVRSTPGAPLLEVRGLTVRFGRVVALDALSLQLAEGEILGLIGPNGAGKTTLFDCVTGLCQPDQGDILLAGRSLLHVPAHRIARLGIGRTFQDVALFSTMTVLDNLRAGQHLLGSGNLFTDALRLRWPRRSAARSSEETLPRRARELAQRFALGEVLPRRAADLPLRLQKRVELARALAAAPRLLLLDEPAGGLDPAEIRELAEVIRHVRDRQGVTVLLIEHDMRLVMSVSDRVAVLESGRKIVEGPPAAVRHDPRTLRVYLGGAAP